MSRIFILFSLTFTLLFSQSLEEFSFIGVTVGVHTIDIDPIADRSSPDKTDETTGGIRFGKQTIDWRTMFTLEGNSNYQSFALEIDKILLDDLFGMPEFRPYLGATLGYIHYEDGPIDGDGFYYGGNAGLLVYITDDIDADLSYHYHKIDGLEPLDSMQGGTLGIHYFY